MLKGSRKMAVMRVKDRMRSGAVLMKMNTVGRGLQWFVVPGREVDEEIARLVIAEPDVSPNNDGLFPGISQSYAIRS